MKLFVSIDLSLYYMPIYLVTSDRSTSVQESSVWSQPIGSHLCSPVRPHHTRHYPSYYV